MARVDWDEYFVQIAEMVAQRSTCDRAYVGAVLVSDKRIISTGYNGVPSGIPHCNDVGHQMSNDHCIATVHAEINAICQAAMNGCSTKGATLYSTHSPCHNCAKAIINAGIVRIVYARLYPDLKAGLLLDRACIPCEEVKWSCFDNKQVSQEGTASL